MAAPSLQELQLMSPTQIRDLRLENPTHYMDEILQQSKDGTLPSEYMDLYYILLPLAREEAAHPVLPVAETN